MIDFLYEQKTTMRKPNLKEIHEKFDGEINEEWSFESNKSIYRLTHGYHRYPAKFIPQIVQKLIEQYTQPNDQIADVFAGCGTTLVESKVHGRKAIGVDINPVAKLITNAKINPIKPATLKASFELLNEKIKEYNSEKKYAKKTHDRIDYWFESENKNQIAFLIHIISKHINNDRCRTFFLCALSNIFKNCSKWLQSSTKPQIDPKKKIQQVFSSFLLQVKKMMNKNEEFYNELQKNKLITTACKIQLKDARHTGIKSNSINAIITSPPYVTSYEYADIHQLSAYWFEYIQDITSFRRKFIGTFYSLNKNLSLTNPSPTAKAIVDELKEIEIKWAREVANYFNDMFLVAKEMYRIATPGGVVCLVIGNTEQKGVKIKSSEVFAEMLYSIGFDIQEVIKRSIPHKLIPTIRDKKTGKFTSLESETSKKVYPNEYIIIARKPDGDC